MRPARCAECPHRGGSGWPEDPYTCDHEARDGRRIRVPEDAPPPEWCPLPVGEPVSPGWHDTAPYVASLTALPHPTPEQVAALDAWTLARWGGTVPRDESLMPPASLGIVVDRILTDEERERLVEHMAREAGIAPRKP